MRLKLAFFWLKENEYLETDPFLLFCWKSAFEKDDEIQVFFESLFPCWQGYVEVVSHGIFLFWYLDFEQEISFELDDYWNDVYECWDSLNIHGRKAVEFQLKLLFSLCFDW